MRNIIKPKTDKLDYGFKVLSNGLKVLLISDQDTNKKINYSLSLNNKLLIIIIFVLNNLYII